jgi:hypothetical protein
VSLNVQFSGGTPRYQFQWLTAINKWADAAGPITLAELRAKAPIAEGPNANTGNHKSGTLRRSIRYSRANSNGNLTITFTGYAPYTGFVVGGTKEHKIRPVNKRYLHFYGTGGGQGEAADVFVGPKGSNARSAYVEHPGTRPNDFNVRALEAVADEVKQLFTDIMSAALGGSAG